MQVQFGGGSYDFRPWRPEYGAVFSGAFAFDCETTRIDEERSWRPPAYVLGAAFDGQDGFFVRREHLTEFLAVHPAISIVFHNAVFDLGVLHCLDRAADVYDRVDRDLVWDTQILHRLYVLGAAGHTASGKGESTLDACVRTYLGMDLPKDVVDSRGDSVRLGYGRWLNRPPSEIESVYLEYLGADVVATYLVYGRLRHLLRDLIAGEPKGWGWVSEEWIEEQERRWGLQTHHIQLRAAIVLNAISGNGLALDLERKDEVAGDLNDQLRQLRDELRRHGLIPGEKGAGKALQAILARLQREYPEIVFPRTPTGKFATSREALEDLSARVSFLSTWFEHQETEKLRNAFLNKMGRRVLHPSFNVLARSGRTTSFGEINAQNLPRNDKVRGCFVPSSGNVFIKADYATIEMAALAQAQIRQFGRPSAMAAAINAGKDLHRLVAARVTGKTESAVTPEERRKAKPINFGKPGGMGNATLRSYARASYGVHLSEEEVASLSDAWFDQFPEMRDFLKKDIDPGFEVARLFGLTPASHAEHTGSLRFLHHPENAGREKTPHRILGWMCLKVLGTPGPQRQNGEPYSDHDQDYFWSCVTAHLDKLPDGLGIQIRGRRPSPALRRAVLLLADRLPAYTLTGRVRAGTTFTSRHNTIFQGLAADGAKLALWLLWRNGFRLVNFIHDEVLIEVAADSDLLGHAERIRDLMIEGMREVLPDMRVSVEYAACDRWYKNAKTIHPNGKLELWHPSESDVVPAQREGESVGTA